MLKKEIRSIYRDKRYQLHSHQIDALSVQIANQVLSMPIWQFSTYHIFITISENNEVDTEPLLSLLQGKDKNIVVPKTYSNGILKNYLLTDSTTIKLNKLGIPEPQDGLVIDEKKIDVVFIPLFAFDRKGYRVGYGGGYYDRFLNKCKHQTLKIGLSFFEAIDNISDVNKTDMLLNFCVTPEKIYEF